MKISVIDIGSNSVRLMMWADGKTLYKRLKTTRLGSGISSGRLSKESVGRTLAAIADFCREAEEWGADELYAFATAAVRSAENGGEFVKRAYEECGVEIDVISGETEARLGVLGALGGGDGGIIDVGGASSEVTFVKGGQTLYSYSLNLGSVRLFDKAGRDTARLKAEIAREVEKYPPFSAANLPTYAVGGTATTLAAVKLGLKEYDPEKTNGVVLTLGGVRRLAEKISSMTVEEVRNLDGMEEGRADVIGGGALLLCGIMEKFGLESVTVSESDNMEGYVRFKEGLK